MVGRSFAYKIEYMTTNKKVSVIGTGMMGSMLARLLLKNGYTVTAWNRSRAKLEPLEKEGVVAAEAGRILHVGLLVPDMAVEGEDDVAGMPAGHEQAGDVGAQGGDLLEQLVAGLVGHRVLEIAQGRAWFQPELVTQQRALMDQYDPEKKIALIVDEWGAWHLQDASLPAGYLYGYPATLRDALISAINLDTFQRHADKVVMANVAQLVNCLHSLFLAHDDRFVATPAFHVFEMYAPHVGGLFAAGAGKGHVMVFAGVALLTSELATNAVVHTGQPFSIHVGTMNTRADAIPST